MATSNQLEEILNSDVDESKILSLVGSLESKLASPTIREPTVTNSTNVLNSNHISGSGESLASSLSLAQSVCQPHTNLSSGNPVLSLVSDHSKQTTAGLTVKSVNGGNFTSSQTHLGHVNSVVSTLAATSGSNASINVSSTFAPQNVKVVGLQQSVAKSEHAVVSNTVGSTNVGTVQYVSTSGGAVLGRNILVGSQPTSTVYDQKRITVQTIKSEGKPSVTAHVLPSNVITLQNVSNTNTQPKQLVQTVVKQDINQVQGGKLVQNAGTRQEVKYVSQSSDFAQQQALQQNKNQIVTSQGVVGNVLKSSAMTLGSGATVITRTTKPMLSPQTVTVLRAPITSQTQAVPHPGQQTIQIVNVSNGSVTRGSAPRSVALGQQRTLAPRIVPSSLTIAPNIRPTGGQAVPGTNIVLPPNYQLPPGTMLVKNDQGQLMLVTQQQAQTFKVPTRTPTAGLVSQSQHLTSVTSASPSLAAVTPSGVPVVGTTLMKMRPQVSITRTHVPSTPGVTLAGAMHPTGVIGSGQQTATIATANQGILESVKKCKNFLSTLLKLASQSNQSPQTIRNVNELIQGLVDGRVEPEDFTAKLQVELKSSPQPYLVPFLKKSLPLLRQSLISNKMHIEGVKPPPPDVLKDNRTQAASSVITSLQHSGSTATVANISTLANKSSHSTAEQYSQLHTIVRQQQAASATKSSPRVVKFSTKCAVSLNTSSPVLSQQSPSAAGHKNKRKYETIKDDDDINDVATMGGVNLSEESRNILATNSELMAGQLQSCKDENFLHTPSLMCRLNAIAKKYGLENVPQDVGSLVSHATQELLRTFVEKLAVIAEHRLEIYKNEGNYEVTDDVRQQLKFLEELEKIEQKRKDEEEREVLLRIAKSRSKHEDPEQLKLKERAKAMQLAELEEMRYREANMTALAAIGPRKKPRLDGSSNGSNIGSASSSGTPGSSSQKTSVVLRPRMKRVNLRDLMFLLEREREFNKSETLFKAFMK